MTRALVQRGGNFVKRDEIALFDSLRDEARISQAYLQLLPKELRISWVHFKQNDLHDHQSVNSQQRPDGKIHYRNAMLHGRSSPLAPVSTVTMTPSSLLPEIS
jgi:hypothetical protein